MAKLSDGSLTTRNEYNAFGEVATNGVSANSIGYTGQRLDNETGLMALGNGERYYSPQFARFIQQDSFAGLPTVPQSLNRFSYAHNNPNKFTDPTGHWIESAWDAFSLGLGIYSFQDNISKGNYWSAALDAVGIVADTAALILPVVPGGVGAGIKALRGVDKAVTIIQTADRAINTGQAIYNAGEAFGEGDIKSGLLNTGFALLGAKGTKVAANDLAKINKAADELADVGGKAQKSATEAAEIIGAKNDPGQLTGIFQKEAKAQKASMMEDLKARDNVVTDYSELAKQRLAESKAKYGDGGNWGGDGFGKYQGNLMDNGSSRPEWLQEFLERGNNFNKKHAFDYPYREVYLAKPLGSKGYPILDGYDDAAEEIISRKFTQLSEIKENTAFNYLRELKNKYPSGAKLADVRSNEGLLQKTKKIDGRQILEVPIQIKPVPKNVLDKARELRITIRDVGGFEY